MWNNRGKLTYKIQEIAVKFLKRPINKTELRLYPYIDFCLKNGGILDWNKINHDEFEILKNLEHEKYLLITGDTFITVTRKFYDCMQDILAEAYVEDFLEEK